MRKLSYVLMFIWVCSAGDSAYEEYRAKKGEVGYLLLDNMLSDRTDTKEFRQAMAARWLKSVLFVFMGVVLYGIVRRDERRDPFSLELKCPDDNA